MIGASIVKGMAITIKRLFRKTETELYPYEKKTLPIRSRIMLAATKNEDGSPACKACGICVRACPDNVIRVSSDPEDKRKAKEFEYFAGRCTFCGICTEACPFNAITFTQEFELANYERRGLIFKLINNGIVRGWEG